MESTKVICFVVKKSEAPFTKLLTDQTLEQEIKELKHHDGIVGLSQNEVNLDGLLPSLLTSLIW